MKRKVIVKGTDLENFVKNVIKENYQTEDEDQLSLDFSGDEEAEYNSVLDMLEERYNDIVREITQIFSGCQERSEECYNTLNEIHDEKIFPLWRELEKIPYDYSSKDRPKSHTRKSSIVEKFNDLEDSLVSYLEIYKEYWKLEEEYKNSIMNLNSILGIQS